MYFKVEKPNNWQHDRIQKTDIIEQYADEPKGLKVGKGKLPDEGDGRDGAVLKPVIIEPEVIIYCICKIFNYIRCKGFFFTFC